MIYTPSILATILFSIIVITVLGLSIYFARQSSSSKGYFAAGGTIPWGVNGIAFAGDYLSAASFLGWATASLSRPLWRRRGAWGHRGAWALLLPLAAYLHALWLYDRADFLGLNVMHGPATSVPPRWNPYLDQQPWWPLLALLAVALSLAALRLRVRSDPSPKP